MPNPLPFSMANATTDREDVREFLPDILGKALARTWIDPEFHQAFDNDPCGTLETHNIFLPENMSIEFQRQNADRPRIVVYEQRPNSKFKMRILYLQLVMMADADGQSFKRQLSDNQRFNDYYPP